MHQYENALERRQAWKAIGIFLLIMALLSTVFQLLMIERGSMSRLLVTGVMWSPGIAAILTCIYLKRSIRSLPWGWGQWRWNYYAWLLPMVYGLLIYLPVWLFGWGGSGFGNPDTLAQWSAEITGAETTSTLAVAIYILFLGTLGIAGSASRALGEEIGWRGFMIWEMRKVMPFWAIGILSGLIWAVWHWPAILFMDYNAGEGNFALQLALFTLGIVPEGIIYAYFTFRSNSLWPAVILHASHNLFLQAIYTPLTIKGEGTHFYIDEFGIMLPISSCLLAVYFYRRAVREGLTR